MNENQENQRETFRKYHTAYGPVRLRKEPNPDAPIIGEIPAEMIVDVVDHNRHWIKVRGYDGWAASTSMERIMETDAPDLEFHSNGSKIVDGKFRNFFGINNIGTKEFTSDLTLRLYRDEALIFETTYTNAESPIQSPGGRNFFAETDVEPTRFEFEFGVITIDGNTKGSVE